MTETEKRAIRNLLNRLREANCGSALSSAFNQTVKQIETLQATLRGNTADEVEVVSRLYLDTWVIPALEALLDGRPSLAAQLVER